MNKISLTCIEIDRDHDGFVVVNMLSSSNDPTIYATGNMYFQHFDGIGFEVGKQYDLNLLPIEPS